VARSGSGSGGAARGLVLTVAVLLAGAATAAVVLSEDAQTLRLAVVGALWAFLLAALAAPRRRAAGEHPDAELAPGKEVELRRTYEIELEREVAARREYELQLEVFLRRELERGLSEQVQELRDEVQRMRDEMIDRLDGELRMERIETTRLIGGSLRALQDEARRLGIGLRVPDPAELTGGYDLVGPPPPAGSAGYQPGEPAAPYRPYADPVGDRPTDAVPSTAPVVGPGPPPPPPPAPPPPAPPAPRIPPADEVGPRRRRRYRDDSEPNDVMSRLLGR
jgi:hypothetical protein